MRRQSKGDCNGVHTVLTQRRSDFESELARKAVAAKKRAKREQTEFDAQRAAKETEHQIVLDRIAKADAQLHRPHHDRRPRYSARPAKVTSLG